MVIHWPLRVLYLHAITEILISITTTVVSWSIVLWTIVVPEILSTIVLVSAEITCVTTTASLVIAEVLSTTSVEMVWPITTIHATVMVTLAKLLILSAIISFEESRSIVASLAHGVLHWRSLVTIELTLVLVMLILALISTEAPSAHIVSKIASIIVAIAISELMASATSALVLLTSSFHLYVGLIILRRLSRWSS